MSTSIDQLVGKDLDEYGNKLGISRYQGLGFPETDEQYRKSIRESVKPISSTSEANKLGMELCHDDYTLYAVVYIDDTGVCKRICASASHRSSNCVAILFTRALAEEVARWVATNQGLGTFEIKKVRCFESIE